MEPDPALCSIAAVLAVLKLLKPTVDDATLREEAERLWIEQYWKLINANEERRRKILIYPARSERLKQSLLRTIKGRTKAKKVDRLDRWWTETGQFELATAANSEDADILKSLEESYSAWWAKDVSRTNARNGKTAHTDKKKAC
ncbi:MAG: hypothetical protein J0M24_19820 [Verrucomicrobia bacterium]|nr:hypothetical protein [Verrucomicrobiota bacterium]